MTEPRRPRATHEMGKRATLQDVAARAGVSAITASRALRQPQKVSAEVRERILQAMDDLGYVANQVASGLASGASRVVPVLIPTLAHTVYVPFLRGVHDALDDRGYEVLLGTTEYMADVESRLVSTFLGWFPAGFLVAGVDHLPATRLRLQQAVAAGMPVVEFMDLTDNPLDMNIGFSHAAVGTAVARYFIDQGRRHVAYAGGFVHHDLRGRRRLDAFSAELARSGLPSHYRAQADEPTSMALGSRMLGELIDRHPEVDAVFFANDDMAAGGLFEARRRGIDVPGTLAIMGFNDLDIAAAMQPTISSVAVDQYGMGRGAAGLFLARVAREALPNARIDSGFRIIERESSAP